MTTYYVGPNGNNSNSGTTSNLAWKTIAYSIARLVAGDTLTVLDGVYTEKLLMTNSGTSTARITIRAANKHKAILDGKFTYNGVLPNWDTLGYSSQTNYVGMRTSFDATLRIYADYITIDGLQIKNSPVRPLDTYQTTGLQVINCKFSNNFFHVALLSSHYVTVDNCDFDTSPMARFAYLDGHTNDWPGVISYSDNGGKPGTDNSVLSNCRFTDCYGEVVHAGRNCTNVSIINNIIKNVSTVGIYLIWGKNVTIANNIIWNVPNFQNSGRGFVGGIVVSDEKQYIGRGYHPSENCKIINNLIINMNDRTGSKGTGIEVRSDASFINSVIAHNTVVHSAVYNLSLIAPATSLYPYSRSGARIYNNIFYDGKNRVTTSLSGWATKGYNVFDSAADAGGLAAASNVYGSPGFNNYTLPSASINPDNYKLAASSQCINKGIAA